MIAGSLATGRVFLARLPRGTDLVEGITTFCVGNNIRLATVQAIGAVEKAVFGYYQQSNREYETWTLERPLEIVSLLGNISLLDNLPFLHAHIIFGDEKGQTLGGHLFKGTLVFSCEFKVTELTGAGRVRGPDPDTGLPLWGL